MVKDVEEKHESKMISHWNKRKSYHTQQINIYIGCSREKQIDEFKLSQLILKVNRITDKCAYALIKRRVKEIYLDGNFDAILVITIGLKSTKNMFVTSFVMGVLMLRMRSRCKTILLLHLHVVLFIFYKRQKTKIKLSNDRRKSF